MMMPLRNAAVTLLLAGVLALQSGCGDAASYRTNDRSMPGAPQEIKSNGVGPMSMRSLSGGAARVGRDQLTRIAEQVPGVEQAVVAMNDEEVVVGIVVDSDSKRRIAEKQVVSQLLWQYPEYDYFVTSDQKLVDRVRAANQNQSVGQYQTRSVDSNNEITSIADEIARQMAGPRQRRGQ